MLTKEEFSERLKKALQDKKMKQSELAKVIETSDANISNYIRGNAFPPLDILVEISKALNISLDWLCGTDTESGRAATPKTLGDIARSVDEMSTWFDAEVSDDCSANTTLGPQSGPGIIFIDGEIKKFLVDSIKMRQLLHDGAFDKTLFDRWMSDRLRTLDEVSLEKYAGGFPF